jgi:hypothetical protein
LTKTSHRHPEPLRKVYLASLLFIITIITDTYLLFRNKQIGQDFCLFGFGFFFLTESKQAWYVRA